MKQTHQRPLSAIMEGEFGRVEVLKCNHDLVMQAHPQTHFGFWLGGGSALTHVAGQVVNYDESTALGANSHESHDLRLLDPQGPALFLMLYIHDEWLDDLCQHLGQPVVLTQAHIAITPAIRQACWDLLHLMGVAPTTDSPSLIACIRWLVAQTIAVNMNALPRTGAMQRRKLIDYRLRVAIAHMRSQLGQAVMAVHLAEVVGLSRSRFFELFHDQLKTSPQVFWNSIRVEEAVRRLGMKQESLTRLATDLGFSTPGNFSRFFRDHKGLSPSHYRKACNAVSPPDRHHQSMTWT